MSAAGGVLSLILLAARPLTKKRFSSGWRYYIWLSVLLAMTVPVSFLSQTLIPALQSGQESGAAYGSRTVQIQALESPPAGFSAFPDVGMTGDIAADAAGGEHNAVGALTEAGGEPEWRPLRYLALHVSLPQGMMTAAGLI